MKHILKRNLSNVLGWKTKAKLVVFESDDWGSVRTTSNEALSALRKVGVGVDNCHYTLYDTLASEEDLSFLFEVLLGNKAANGSIPQITANSLVANPDFSKIKESNFLEYHFESFKTSLAKYSNQHRNAYKLWQQGMEAGVFKPQSHGREHLNIDRWMQSLQAHDKDTMLAFEHGIAGLSGHIALKKRGSFLAAFDGNTSNSSDKREIVNEALQLFKTEFGFSSQSFIAPNYVWNDSIEDALNENGVKYIQGTHTQRISKDFDTKLKIKYHYLGQKNRNNQFYLTRNCTFEPSSNPSIDWVDSCLKEIENSFLWKRPAIIATHRVNFIGFLNSENRDQSLKKLDTLLKVINKKWPDVTFTNSEALGSLILK